jgi:hypothetical protein
MISPEVMSTIIDYLDEVIYPLLTKDISSYAPGRNRAWLEYEAPLSLSQPWQRGIHDDRIWSYVMRIATKHDFTPDIGLVSKGGTISQHRDAPYANFMAMGINLGECTWEYQECYPGYKWTPDQNMNAPTEIHNLIGGEVFFFNCKNPHAVTQASANRWAINLWSVSKKGIDGFNTIKEVSQ